MQKYNTNGCIPQEKDVRDYLFAEIAQPGSILPATDLRVKCSHIENQGALGSCVYNAAIGALEYLEIKSGESFIDKSRLFAYYCGRADMNKVEEDCGDTIRHAMKILADYGTCNELLWEYDVKKFADRPPVECYVDAIDHQITAYYAVKSINAIRKCLSENYPVVFGAKLFPQFENVGRSGIVVKPVCGKQSIGNHAMLIVGHNDDIHRFIVRNSWGISWGDSGYCYISYNYLKQYGFDYWTIRKEN